MLGWWRHKDDSNVLFLKYEDMKEVNFSASDHMQTHALLQHKKDYKRLLIL